MDLLRQVRCACSLGILALCGNTETRNLCVGSAKAARSVCCAPGDTPQLRCFIRGRTRSAARRRCSHLGWLHRSVIYTAVCDCRNSASNQINPQPGPPSCALSQCMLWPNEACQPSLVYPRPSAICICHHPAMHTATAVPQEWCLKCQSFDL